MENGKTESSMNEPRAEQGVDTSRRNFSRIGVAAPVLMTLASQPVFGAQCLSNMMSGNLSDPNRGQCYFGWSPGGWGQPGGAAPSWSWVPYEQGTCSGVGNNHVCTGGTLLSETPLWGTALLAGVPDNTLIHIIAHYQQSGTPVSWHLTRHAVCALLNALASPPGMYQYILTVDQLVDLLNGGPLPPPFTDLMAFLDWTWSGGTEGGM